MWPWNKTKTKVKHNVFAWEDADIVLVLVNNNPLGVDRLYVPNNGRYTLDKTQVYYKVIEKNTKSTLLAIAKDLVEEVIITSDLTE